MQLCKLCVYFFLIVLLPLRSTLFPYTTLFRSGFASYPGGGEQARCGNQAAVGRISAVCWRLDRNTPDRKSTRLNSSHVSISYAVFCLKKKIAGTKTSVLARAAFEITVPTIARA